MRELLISTLLLSPLSFSAPSTDRNLDTLLHAVEQRYNRARTLSLDFSEGYIAGNRTRRTEFGTLQLRKPGKMRWTYREPAGKIFLSDGKNLYLFKPDTRTVEKTALRESEDLRAPLAFLLGKLNFYKEFSSFEATPDPAGTWIAARPNSADLPYSEVRFLVSPDARIVRLRVQNDDLSSLDFTFTNEILNPEIDASRFVFRLPAGSELVEGAE